jgi:cobalamin biosynthesis protein CobD/CbiB
MGLLIPLQMVGVFVGILLPAIVVLIIFRFLWDISGYAEEISHNMREINTHIERIADELEHRDLSDDDE